MSTATAPAPAGGADDRVATRSFAAIWFSRPEAGALIGAIAIIVLFLLVAPAFREIANIGTILYQSSTIGIMAVPVAALMVGGEFDLSAGVAVATASLAASQVSWALGLNLWVGIVVSLLLALAVGWFNGFLLRVTKLPSFLITLGTFFILQGVNLALTRDVSGGVTSPDISKIDGFGAAKAVFASQVTLGSIQLNITVLFWIVLTAVAAYVVGRTKVGNWVFAVGGDEGAARAVGVPVARTKTGLFLFVGFSAWLLGMHTLFNFNTVQSNQGVGNEFIYIIAAVVGGCLLTGGYGSIVGAAIGALIYGMTNLGITYAGWNPDWLKTFVGIMLVAATVINMVVRRRAASR